MYTMALTMHKQNIRVCASQLLCKCNTNYRNIYIDHMGLLTTVHIRKVRHSRNIVCTLYKNIISNFHRGIACFKVETNE